MSELKEFRLPDVGEGLTEAEIVAWHVKPGDPVKDGQIIIEIETAKAVVELPSPYTGTVTSLLVEAGQTVDVGAPIITVDTSPGGTASAAPATVAPSPAETAAEVNPAPPERQAVLVGYGVKASSTTRRPRKPPASEPRGAVTPGLRSEATREGATSERLEVSEQISTANERILAKPPVRKLAKDLGVSLAGLSGTGPSGSITRDDVQRAADGTQVSKPAAATTVSYEDQRIPIRGVRKHMAAAMVASAFTAPHVTEFLQVDVTDTMAATRRVRDLPEFESVRVSPLLFVARALLVAVARHPLINSSWDEAAQEIVVHGRVNLGIAVAADRGLIVPNVKNAGAMSMPRLALALQELTETARAGKATPADLGGGTITITNVGVFGVDAGTPILTPGEAAILAFGQVKDAPWVVDGQLAVRKICTLSLSFDHRIVDGELGSAVLRDVGSMLEDPVRMLAWT
jgi:2-oxoisovalerate dehydrogenase E2 component (dihydrolipoyl transacylase)